MSNTLLFFYHNNLIDSYCFVCHVFLDTLAAVNEKQKLLVKQRQEIDETERNSDKEVCPDYWPCEFIVARCIFQVKFRASNISYP